MLGAHMAIVWKVGVELQPGMSLLKIRDSRIKELKGSGGHIGESEEDLAAFLEDVPFSYSGPSFAGGSILILVRSTKIATKARSSELNATRSCSPRSAINLALSASFSCAHIKCHLSPILVATFADLNFSFFGDVRLFCFLYVPAVG